MGNEPHAERTPLRLGDLQLAILRVLWREGESTVVRVHGVVSARRGGSPSTIATMLTKMEARGLVARRREGRQHLWHAVVAEDQARRSMVADVTARMFGGDPLELVSHLVREAEIDGEDLDALRDLVERRARGAEGGGR